MPKEITLDDYKNVSDEFFAKYNFVLDNMPDGAKADDVIKVMQQLAALVIKKRAESKTSTVGFMKEEIENDA